jgi:hypothetical protein
MEGRNEGKKEGRKEGRKRKKKKIKLRKLFSVKNFTITKFCYAFVFYLRIAFYV